MHILKKKYFPTSQKTFTTNQTIIRSTYTSRLFFFVFLFFLQALPKQLNQIIIWATLRPGRLLGHFAMFGALFLTFLEKKEVEQNTASCCRADAVWLCRCQEIPVSSICKDVWSHASRIHVVP